VEVVPGLDGECGYENDSAGRAFGFSLLYVLVNIYLFLGIAIICDNQFTASLEMICSEFGLNLNKDIAGATFMAAGSSAPELATSFVGTFLSESNVGVGTIIGSAVFNILVIIGATACLSPRPLHLDWRPVVRDNFFYLISVILLVIVITVGGDDDIDTKDSIILLAWYTAYICYMGINQRMIDKFCPIEDEEEQEETDATEAAVKGDRSVTPSDVNTTDAGSESKTPIGTGSTSGNEADVEMGEAAPAAPNQDEALPKKKSKSIPQMHFMSHQDEELDSEEEEEEGIEDKILEVLSVPWEMLFKYTMPDCFYPFELIEGVEEKIEDPYYYLGGFMDEDYPEGKDGEDEDPDHPGQTYLEARKAKFKAMSDDDKEKKKMLKHQAEKRDLRKRQLAETKCEEFKDLDCQQRWFWATFFISLLHITWVSYFMVEFMTKVGCLWHISDTVMGLTFLAMGTSIPDALGSLAVAKKGEGDMAVSNAVGSNVFDICMGLGLPWFIKCVAGSGPIKIDDTDAIIPSILILVAIIVLLFSTFAFSKWWLQPQVGYILLAAYLAFVIYSLVYEGVK
jgi:K+-dependent Na+/Ca+ exchanger-like protein